MDTEQLVSKIELLIAKAEDVIATSELKPNTFVYVDAGEMVGLRVAGLAFIGSVFGQDHVYFEEFRRHSDGDFDTNAESAFEILKAARDDIHGGWLSTVGDLVSASIFTDMLEMADHLWENSYKNAAAVSAGIVLETHLRRLCEKHEVELTVQRGDKLVPKKADVMNSDLVKKRVFNNLDQKNVTSWLGLRNEAAHGNDGAYELSQVRIMIDGVSNFIARVA